MADSSESCAPGHVRGGRRLGNTTACDAATKNARAASAPDWRRRATTQSLYLLHTVETRGWLPAVCSASAHRDRLALLRDGREPQPAHHCAGSSCDVAGLHRRDAARRMTARTGATAVATPDPRAAVPVHAGVLALGTLRANKRLQSDGAQRP